MKEEMRGLAQGILASHEARATGVASIRRDVSAQREWGRRHVQELGGIRREASRTQRGHLAEGRVALARNEGHRQSEARRWLTDVAFTRTQHATQMRATLAQSRAVLEVATAKSRGEAQASLKGLASTRTAMARQLRDILSREKAGLIQADAHRRSEFLGWMGEVAADHGAARKEWQNLASTMRARRAGGVGVAEAAVEVEAVEVGEVTAEFADLSARVFAHLSSHSDGTRLSELEREFVLGRFQAARVVRHLMNEGKARKQGLLYFAT